MYTEGTVIVKPAVGVYPQNKILLICRGYIYTEKTRTLGSLKVSNRDILKEPVAKEPVYWNNFLPCEILQLDIPDVDRNHIL